MAAGRNAGPTAVAVVCSRMRTGVFPCATVRVAFGGKPIGRHAGEAPLVIMSHTVVPMGAAAQSGRSTIAACVGSRTERSDVSTRRV